MSYSAINRVVLLGRLTRDPEPRMLPSGETVYRLRVACNSSWRLPEGSYEERPNYFDVEVLGTLGESLPTQMHNGARVGIDGRLEWREWKNSFQEKREAVSIVADAVQFLDSPRSQRDRRPRLELVGADEATLAF
jgi:single-strand DNA-binding protein